MLIHVLPLVWRFELDASSSSKLIWKQRRYVYRSNWRTTIGANTSSLNTKATSPSSSTGQWRYHRKSFKTPPCQRLIDYSSFTLFRLLLIFFGHTWTPIEEREVERPRRSCILWNEERRNLLSRGMVRKEIIKLLI